MAKDQTPSKAALHSGPGDYDLAIDSQVEKFVEAKQKLTYFLITVSSAVTAFIMRFIVDHVGTSAKVSGPETAGLVLVTGAAMVGLATVGCSLGNLHLEHRSYARHLRYRYERKAWGDLDANVTEGWNRLNTWAARFLRAAFVLQFLQIGFAVAFFLDFYW